MNHPLPSPSPSPYSTAITMMDAVEVGARLGRNCAFYLALLYGAVLPAFFFFTYPPIPPESLHDLPVVLERIWGFYSTWVQVSVVTLLIGMIPALLIGYMSGWLMGKIFLRWVPTPLVSAQAIHLGFWISLVFGVMRLALGGLWIDWKYSNDPFVWMLWYGPNLIAFFGLWWVAYRLNTKMHEAYLPFSASAK